MTDRDAFIHFTAGALGGTVGTALTCPLEVIKVRLQSSSGCGLNGSGGPSTSGSAGQLPKPSTGVRNIIPQLSSWVVRSGPGPELCHDTRALASSSLGQETLRSLLKNKAKQLVNVTDLRQVSTAARGTQTLAIFGYMRHIAKNEGYSALWKGLGPNLVGVAPSKAVYFYSYSSMKKVLNDVFVPNTPIVHMCSAGFAAFLAATVINPVWLVKTRLQLDRTAGQSRLTIGKCIKKVYKTDGVKGFYRGVTASYAGISETVLQFVIYEHLRSLFVTKGSATPDDRHKFDFVRFMLCAGAAKLCATSATYPHEVCRTRMREEGTKYRGFWKTLLLVAKEEKRPGLYRGLTVHLMRTVPNTAITMGTYELVVHLLTRLSNG